jgi:hypothetical protein
LRLARARDGVMACGRAVEQLLIAARRETR